jgi:hypothetical protein
VIAKLYRSSHSAYESPLATSSALPTSRGSRLLARSLVTRPSVIAAREKVRHRDLFAPYSSTQTATALKISNSPSSIDKEA